jgi:hypothetical protein
VSLAAFLGTKQHELRAPDEETRFFRHFRARALVQGGPPRPGELLYHAIGWVGPCGRFVMEIDPHGNSRTRFYPPVPLDEV